ncbi:hypothetical protein [Streptomyces olivaceiscleroticus]|uniref:Uncharacterized protein n=1 Tax=Streptomyces olivaceiscleroticus TaxID=68245 RepID=A0ABN1BMS0_9ACTN
MTDHAAEVARIEAERALLPKEERQRLEAADAPMLRIQLLHTLERAKKAERALGHLTDRYREHEDTIARVQALHAPVQHMGRTWCGECSVRRSTGPKSEEWVAFVPHPCPTLDALENKES